MECCRQSRSGGERRVQKMHRRIRIPEGRQCVRGRNGGRRSARAADSSQSTIPLLKTSPVFPYDWPETS